MKLEEYKLNVDIPCYQSSVKSLPFTPGLWVDGKCYWLQNCAEKVIYEEELIVKVKHEQPHSRISFTHLYVGNHGKKIKQVKLLAMYCSPNISQEYFSFVSPTDNRIFHLAGKNVFLMNALYGDREIKEYTIQPYWNVFTDRIWGNLPAGQLHYQPMLKGSAAIIFAAKLELKPRETNKMSAWTICGDSKSEVLSLDQALLKLSLKNHTSISF